MVRQILKNQVNSTNKDVIAYSMRRKVRILMINNFLRPNGGLVVEKGKA